MHIEPGVLAAPKVIGANVTAVATLGARACGFVKRPDYIVKTVLAAGFFSVFMEAFHVPVGASELHFVGASAVYLLFGFLPTLFGFALGLLLQGLLFEQGDLVHLGVNSLSLMVPLIAVHAAYGRRFFADDNKIAVTWTNIVKFDAMYYTGVTGMVGFWLALGNEPTPFINWAWFALSYLPLVLCEPVISYASVRLLKSRGADARLTKLTAANELAVI